jgi:hypothetical protein
MFDGVLLQREDLVHFLARTTQPAVHLEGCAARTPSFVLTSDIQCSLMHGSAVANTVRKNICSLRR